MRKIVLVAFAFSFVFSLSTVVFAQETSSLPTPKPTIEDLRERQKDLRQDIAQDRSNFKDKEASRIAQLRARKLQILKQRFTFISRNLTAYLARLNKISEKIANRIAKLNARGVDTSKAQTSLNEAKSLRDAAKAAIDQAIIDCQSVGSAQDVKTAVQKASASIKNARQALFNYHKKLVEVTTELKESRELKEGTRSAESD